MVKQKVVKLIKKIYPRLGLRDSDIILASYPKSGNTWVRFIWLNTVSLLEFDGKEIDFHLINGPLNAEYDSYSYGDISYKSLPRLVKTHLSYDKRFNTNKSIYVVRNPGDVMVSYFEYQKAKKSMNLVINDLSTFLRSNIYGIDSWCSHVKSWTNQADVIISYESLKDDALNEMRRALTKLGIDKDVNDKVISKAIKRSSFTNMRKIEEKKGRPNMKKKFRVGYKFTRKGSTGEWKQKLNNKDISFIRSKIKEYDLSEFYSI